MSVYWVDKREGHGNSITGNYQGTGRRHIRPEDSLGNGPGNTQNYAKTTWEQAEQGGGARFAPEREFQSRASIARENDKDVIKDAPNGMRYDKAGAGRRHYEPNLSPGRDRIDATVFGGDPSAYGEEVANAYGFGMDKGRGGFLAEDSGRGSGGYPQPRGAQQGHDAGMRRHFSGQEVGVDHFDAPMQQGHDAGRRRHFSGQEGRESAPGPAGPGKKTFDHGDHLYGASQQVQGGDFDYPPGVNDAERAAQQVGYDPDAHLKIGRHAYRARDHFSDGFDQVGAHGHSRAQDNEALGPGHGGGKRFIGSQDHMQSSGVSAPPSAPHGHGRAYIPVVDHQVIQEDHRDWQLVQGEGRKHIDCADHLKSEVLIPLAEDMLPDGTRPPTPLDMKDSIREWLEVQFAMDVHNEERWRTEVCCTTRGSHWVIEALTEKKQTISREGPTAMKIAEKLSMMPQHELKYFAVRFRPPTGPEQKAGPAVRSKQTPSSGYNWTMNSPGVNSIMGKPGGERGAPEFFSAARKDPLVQVQRRYIASGQDHFDEGGQAIRMDSRGRAPEGKPLDDDFSGGIERGIGHGKRYIGAADHIFGGGGEVKSDAPSVREGQQGRGNARGERDDLFGGSVTRGGEREDLQRGRR